MIENRDSKIEALENLLGKDNDRIPRLMKAEQVCLNGTLNPCWLCSVQGQVARTQPVRIAQEIAEICCPEGKRPDYLIRLLAVTSDDCLM